MSLVSHFRVVKFAFQDFFRNFWLSVATLSVLLLTLISVNMLLAVNVLGQAALAAVADLGVADVLFDCASYDKVHG